MSTKIETSTDEIATSTVENTTTELEKLKAQVEKLKEDLNEHKSKADNYSRYMSDLAEHGDQIEFKSHGLNCFMFRNQMSTWCAYVEVPEGHVLYGWSYSKINSKRLWDEEKGSEDPLELIFDGVNGEFTYSKGVTNGQWRLGWDYIQWNDYSPMMPSGGLWGDASSKHYWDANEVKKDITKVAKGFSLITKERLDKVDEEEEDEPNEETGLLE